MNNKSTWICSNTHVRRNCKALMWQLALTLNSLLCYINCTNK